MLTGLYAKLIGAGVIVAAVLGAVWYVNSLKSTIRDLEQQLVTCVAQGNVLSQKIEDQNNAVEAMKKEAEARQQAADVAIAAAKAETKKAKGRATIIYKTAPSTPGNDCKSALDLVNGVTQ